MDVLERFTNIAKENKTILCFGIDPDLSRIQNYQIVTGRTVEKIVAPYFEEMVDRLLEEHAISAIKPNYAYFAQYGFDGLFVLKELIQRYKNKIPIIFDGKRGDIGKTSEAYAREVYDFWDADAVTVSPYMGSDSIKPFLRPDKLVYVLCKTSNHGSKEFQNLKVEKKALFEHVATKALSWKCGLVVGAISNSIRKISKITKGRIPLLIPGIGAQGGDLEIIMKTIKQNLWIHRINASSSIAYAYEKNESRSPFDAAIAEAEKLNQVIKKRLC